MPNPKMFQLFAEFQICKGGMTTLVISSPFHFQGVEAFERSQMAFDHIKRQTGIPFSHNSEINN